jgi:hypothetical protein
MTNGQMSGLTKLTCEFNLIDHAQGDQYLYVRVETEVPTIAGDWDDSGQVKDVFSGLTEMILRSTGPNGDFTLDEGVLLYRDGDLMA